MHLYYMPTLLVSTLQCSFFILMGMYLHTPLSHLLTSTLVYKHVSIMVWMTMLRCGYNYHFHIHCYITHYNKQILTQSTEAHCSLPLLATLFLFSYTKVLRIVSSVLFSYSTITHLPSKHTTLVWSIDATLPLFGVKFTIMFIMCISLPHAGAI